MEVFAVNETHQIVSKALQGQLSIKIDYLSQVQQAIQNEKLAPLYRLLDKQRYDDVTQSDQADDAQENLAFLVQDNRASIAQFLAPDLLAYIKSYYPFFELYPLDSELVTYSVFIGDWWNHRQIGVLDIINVRFDLNEEAIDKLRRTSQLEHDQSIYDTDIDEINKIMVGLSEFLDDATKRQLEIRVIDDQIEQLHEDKKGFFVNRADQKTRDELQKKRQLLLASEKRVPAVEEKLKEHQHELLELEKESTLLDLELKVVLEKFTDYATFEQTLHDIYRAYIANLLGKEK